jgi:chromosome condensin MukBEF complex kleisin-like MukF subunit
MNQSLINEWRRRLQEYYQAESAILENQSYTIDDKIFTRADLRYVQKLIQDLEQKINNIDSAGQGSIRVRSVVFSDL